VHPAQQHLIGDVLRPGDIESNYAWRANCASRCIRNRWPAATGGPMLQLHIPLFDQGLFAGVVLGEFSVDGLLRYGMPSEVQARYAVSLLDAKGNVIAGNTTNLKEAARACCPGPSAPTNTKCRCRPVGNALLLRAQAYRTSQGVVGNGFFWLVSALSVLTVWMLIGTWRHTRRRLQAQQALVAETNFRRAMENSMLTGMRALDLQGRITYVNAASAQMTGWSEAELVGRTPPFPYWPSPTAK
jgi:PAS domain-containing protein